MTSTLKPAPTSHRLRGFAARRPEWFAILVGLAYVLPQVGLWLLMPPRTGSITAGPLGLAGHAWMVLVPAALLTVLGWWGTAGFTRRSTLGSLVQVLPLLLLFVVAPASTLLVFGVAGHSPGYATLVAVIALAVGFGQEATFRGVVLQTLLPNGTTRAVIISSVLFGAAYIGIIAADVESPVIVGAQALNAVGMGVAFAAVVVVTGTIWPLVLIDAGMQVPFFFVAGASADPGIVTIIVTALFELLIGSLAAAYGIWLLHRRQPGRRPPRRGRPARMTRGTTGGLRSPATRAGQLTTRPGIVPRSALGKVSRPAGSAARLSSPRCRI